MTDPAVPGERMRFARDVAVSVTSNLITASIIYLVGVTAGVFPRDSRVIMTATIVVMFGIGVALTIPLERSWPGLMRRHERRHRIVLAAFYGSALFGVTMVIALGDRAVRGGPLWVTITLQLFVIFGMIFLIRDIRRKRREYESGEESATRSPTNRAPSQRGESN